MKGSGWPVWSCAALAALAVAACGLDSNGLESDEGGLAGADANPDTTVDDDAAAADGFVDSTLPPVDAPTPDAGVDSSPLHDAATDSAPDSGPGPCANTPTSCGPPGACVNCTGSANGGACVSGACGCNSATDCPSLSACEGNHTCGTGCGGVGASACNGGCCSLFTCVAYDNGHCGSPTCSACSGQTPTCGANGTCNGNCGGATDGTCQTSCCNDGTCAAISGTTCGNFGAACVNCSGSDAGSSCELIGLNEVCGCDGPPSDSQCPPGNACYNEQCTTACDGQHPCNGGCCSGNNLASSTCVPSCEAGTCTGNYCQ